ncbi:MAG: helix-turn-helix transcriptional regulator [Croceitalea sp.]|nr:TetR/AcrR family transcriptional regulator; helix-turn-helix transcriptional regulator [Croceitalea sp.]MBT8239455.1 TetR/AcrR family transcriptional regulator; helix-turn-helix transcriptional regulator [Croceitalea sp.]NNC33535.1 helix-turn-helix transcriptional regulator [Croceitalea sp.]NNL07898.1 helix-turn-helix transcriptional regulator [Croceitalea sp.]NNM16929.1 helix-turn-helix transcriptional regulator [Croceitalea sp.]
MDITLHNSKMLHLMRAKGLELFYRNGYYNTSVKALVEDLGISEKEFFKNFQSKEDFFISIAQNLILQRTLNLLIEPVAYKQSPFPLILDVLDAQLLAAENNDNDFGFMLSNFINEFNGRNSRINKYLLDILNIWEINLNSILKKGQLDGYLNHQIDSSSVANHIISSYFGVRTRMVEGNASTLRLQYLQQMRYYFYSISQKQAA